MTDIPVEKLIKHIFTELSTDGKVTILSNMGIMSKETLSKLSELDEFEPFAMKMYEIYKELGRLDRLWNQIVKEFPNLK